MKKIGKHCARESVRCSEKGDKMVLGESKGVGGGEGSIPCPPLHAFTKLRL